MCGEMHERTTHEIIAMTAAEYPDLKSVKPRWRASSSGRETCRCRTRLEYGTKSGEILDPSKVEKAPLREPDLMIERNMHELVKEMLMHTLVPTYMRSGSKTTRVMRSDADKQQRSWPSVRGWLSRKVHHHSWWQGSGWRSHHCMLIKTSFTTGLADLGTSPLRSTTQRWKSWCAFARREVRAHLGIAGSSTEL